VLLGMGGMMAGAIRAPLAGLTAMMELTYNPGVIMPGMLVVTVASPTASELFRTDSLYNTMLRAAGLDYSADPVLQALRRIGVGGVMNRNFVRLDSTVSLDKVGEVLARHPDWLLVDREGASSLLMRAIDLARYLQDDQEEEKSPETIDLLAIPAQRMGVASVHLEATLQEALERLDSENTEALYVQRMTAPGIMRIYGVLTREMLKSAYRY